MCKQRLIIKFDAGVMHGNPHVLQALIDVINEEGDLCRCPLVTPTRTKIGEITRVNRHEELGENVISVEVNLSKSFVTMFDMKEGDRPLPAIKFHTSSGLINQVELCNWADQFARRKTV